MRADRLIALMLMLHRKGRCTAQELAADLKVSERTIYRDLDALSTAGIPVYAQSGPNGGVYLDEHYRVSLTGLSLKEAQGLFIRNDTDPVNDLGLTTATTLLKLFAALPITYRSEVERMRERFYVDSGNWLQPEESTSYLALLQQALWEDKRLEIDYQPYSAAPGTRLLEPYGLVAKAGVWYLVAKKVDGKEGEMRSYRVSRLKRAIMTTEHFARDPDFDLAQYWHTSRDQFERATVDLASEPYEVVLRVHPDQFWYFPRHLSGFYEQLDAPDPDRWIRLHVRFFSLSDARMNLFRLGTDADVLSPDELRNVIVDTARKLLTHYGATSG